MGNRGGGGGSINIFHRQFFCLTALKISVRESFTVATISEIGKFWLRGKKCQDFPSKFPFLTVPKISVGKSFTVAIISDIEKVSLRWGGFSRWSFQDCPLKIFCLTVPTISVGVGLFSVSLLSGIKKV